MEAVSIPHSQLSSSSDFNVKKASKYARLNWYRCWRPFDNSNQWLRVELSSMHNINGLITQGGGTVWVQIYEVQYQETPGSPIKFVLDGDGITEVGNSKVIILLFQ